MEDLSSIGQQKEQKNEKIGSARGKDVEPDQQNQIELPINKQH